MKIAKKKYYIRKTVNKILSKHTIDTILNIITS